MAGSRRNSHRKRRTQKRNADLNPNNITIPGAEAPLNNYYSYGGHVLSFDYKTNETKDIHGTPGTEGNTMFPTDAEIKRLGYSDQEIGSMQLKTMPSIHLKLFYTDNCFSCHKLKNETIPALINQHKGATNAVASRVAIDQHPITIFGEIYVAENRKQEICDYYQKFLGSGSSLSLPFIVMELISPPDGKNTASPQTKVLPYVTLEQEEREKRTKLLAIDTYGLLDLISPWSLIADVIFAHEYDFIGLSPFTKLYYGGVRRRL